MECSKIELLLGKYFDGATSMAQEKALRDYFASSDVAPHLSQYQPLFDYFSLENQQQYLKEPKLRPQKSRKAWFSIAATVVILLGIGTYGYLNYNAVNSVQNLGTYDDPEIAFRETQKALALLSDKVNTGIESVQYVKEYETAKNKIFRKD